MSITSSGVIIIPEKGLVVPKAYLELCYKYFHDFGSSCYRLEDAGNPPEFLISGDKKLLSIEDMMKALEALKDEPGIIYFANVGELSKESEQPFEIIKDEAGKPIAVAFIEGEYPQHSTANSVDTDECNVADVIGMTLRKTYTRLCSGDMAKFEEELAAEDTQRWVNSLCANRGVVQIMTLTGKVFPFVNGNDLGEKFPWGYVSNKLGFVEQSSQTYQEMKPPPSEAPKGRGSMLDRIRGKITGPSVAIADTKPLDTTKVEVKADTAVKPEAPMIKPPEDLKKKKEWKKIKQWYDNWTEPHGLTKDDMLEGKAAPANERWIGQNVGKFMKKDEALEQLKDKIEKSSGEPGSAIPKAPVITPRMRHVVAALLESDHAKAITEGGKVLDPKDLKEGPKVAPFSAQQGYPIDKVFRWDDRLYEDFLKKCHVENDWTPAILLFRELRDDLMALMIDEPKHDKNGNIVVPPEEPEVSGYVPPVELTVTSTPKQSLLDQIKARKAAASAKAA